MKEKLQKILDITFWKFVLVGIINTLVGTTVMFVAYNFLHFSYWVSSASNYVVGSIVSYFLNKYFTFQNNEKSLGQLFKFILQYVICWPMDWQSQLFHGSYRIRAGVFRIIVPCWWEWERL